MNYNIFFISDTHFSHQNFYSFLNDDGSKVRPWNNCEEADEIMIQNWNNIVKPTDKVYHLGDLGFKKTPLHNILPRLNGRKCLIRGNHDGFKPSFYTQYFYDIRGCYNLENYLLTHIPVHPTSKSRFIRNIHGHVHSNPLQDKWYKCVCVECINYTPVSFEEIKKETQELIDNGII